jgi:Zn-dependent M28 family amino/carboxypeptidase
MERDLYILGTTAEEWGLLGAQAFADQPPLPLENIVAAFNFDTVAISPRGSPVGFIGEGRTPLDAIIKEAINDIGRELAPRELSEPFLQRQDGWALLQRDVPSVLLSNAFGSEKKLTEFLSGHYHQASDNPGDIELGGAVDDLLLHELLIRRVADSAVYP